MSETTHIDFFAGDIPLQRQSRDLRWAQRGVNTMAPWEELESALALCGLGVKNLLDQAMSLKALSGWSERRQQNREDVVNH